MVLNDKEEFWFINFLGIKYLSKIWIKKKEKLTKANKEEYIKSLLDYVINFLKLWFYLDLQELYENKVSLDELDEIYNYLYKKYWINQSATLFSADQLKDLSQEQLRILVLLHYLTVYWSKKDENEEEDETNDYSEYSEILEDIVDVFFPNTKNFEDLEEKFASYWDDVIEFLKVKLASYPKIKVDTIDNIEKELSEFFLYSKISLNAEDLTNFKKFFIESERYKKFNIDIEKITQRDIKSILFDEWVINEFNSAQELESYIFYTWWFSVPIYHNKQKIKKLIWKLDKLEWNKKGKLIKILSEFFEKIWYLELIKTIENWEITKDTLKRMFKQNKKLYEFFKIYKSHQKF